MNNNATILNQHVIAKVVGTNFIGYWEMTDGEYHQNKYVLVESREQIVLAKIIGFARVTEDFKEGHKKVVHSLCDDDDLTCKVIGREELKNYHVK